MLGMSKEQSEQAVYQNPIAALQHAHARRLNLVPVKILSIDQCQQRWPAAGIDRIPDQAPEKRKRSDIEADSLDNDSDVERHSKRSAQQQTITTAKLVSGGDSCHHPEEDDEDEMAQAVAVTESSANTGNGASQSLARLPIMSIDRPTVLVLDEYLDKEAKPVRRKIFEYLRFLQMDSSVRLQVFIIKHSKATFEATDHSLILWKGCLFAQGEPSKVMLPSTMMWLD